MLPSEIIQQIRSGGQEQLGKIYEEYRTEFLQWAIKEFGCSLEDSKDIYQVTILIFYDNVKTGKLEHLVSSVKTYIYGIGKNIVKEHMRKSKRHTPIAQEKWLKEYLIDEPHDFTHEESIARAKNALEKLGEPCQKLIELFYYQKKTMDEISTLLNYKNAETAKNQKCKCMARLRKLLEEEMIKPSIATTHGTN
jgi:RNA polymerase sigma-70 factor (ECF subfamily)